MGPFMYVWISLLFLFGYWFYMLEDREERYVFFGLYLLAAFFGGTIAFAVVTALLFAVEVIGRHWWVDDGSE